MARTIRCNSCGIEEDAELIDCKDDGTGNFTICECIRCYGPDWLPTGSCDLGLSVAPSLRPHYWAFITATEGVGQ